MLRSSTIQATIGAILLLAGLLKASSVGSGVLHIGGLQGQVCVIFSELTIATLCLWGGVPKVTRAILVLLFTCFTIHALYLIFIGSASCGCFGQVKLHPAWSFVLDSLILIWLFLWNPTEGESPSHHGERNCFSHLIVVYCTVIISGAAWLLVSWPTSLHGNMETIAAGETVFLKPEEWRGKILPLVPFINVGTEMIIGDWLVVLVHQDCKECQSKLPEYLELAFEYQISGHQRRVALIEMPPFEDSPLKEFAEGSPILYGRLSPNHLWIVETPVEIKMIDGVVL